MENEKLNTIEDFAAYVKDHIFDNAPDMADNYKAEIKDVLKNNGLVLHGLTIKQTDKSDGAQITPTLYLEKFFDQFKDGDPIGEILDKIRDVYENHKAPKNISVDFFKDYSQVSERLSIKVINYDMNRDFLKDVPHYKYGDLAAIFQVQVNQQEYGTMTVTVKNENMKSWNVTAEDMLAAATINMEEKQPPRITGMFEVLNELMGMDMPGMEMPEEPGMYVMSNESKMNGAAGIIFTEKLQEFADEKGADLFILPSSLHELILVPDQGNMNAADLKAMVQEVNATQLEPEDRLSNNVYLYDRTDKQLMIADTKEPLKLQDMTKDQAKSQDKDKPKSIKDRLEEGKAKVAAKALEPKPVKDKVKQKSIE